MWIYILLIFSGSLFDHLHLLNFDAKTQRTDYPWSHPNLCLLLLSLNNKRKLQHHQILFCYFPSLIYSFPPSFLPQSSTYISNTLSALVVPCCFFSSILFASRCDGELLISYFRFRRKFILTSFMYVSGASIHAPVIYQSEIPESPWRPQVPSTSILWVLTRLTWLYGIRIVPRIYLLVHWLFGVHFLWMSALRASIL